MTLPDTEAGTIGFKGSNTPLPLTHISGVSQDAFTSLDLSCPSTEFMLVSIKHCTDPTVSLLFLAESFSEATLLIIGFSVLLDSETFRCGIRGDTPVSLADENTSSPSPPDVIGGAVEVLDPPSSTRPRSLP